MDWRPWVGLLAAGHAAAACRTTPTHVELVVGTDAPTTRAIELSAFIFDGILSTEQAASRAATSRPPLQLAIEPNRRSNDFVGSFGLLPAQPSRTAASSSVTVLVRASFAATDTAPRALVERVAYVTMLRGLRGTTRVNLALSCANRAEGCTSVSAPDCTVSVRCIEQGLTCGASGRCVEPEIPVNYGADAGTDGGERPDGSTGRVVLAPRQIAPLSTSTASSSRPEFRWINTGAATGARVDICSDRSCTQIRDSFVAEGDRARPANPLPRGVSLFWRLRGRLSGEESSQTSAIWQLRSRGFDGAIAETSSGVEGDYNGDGRTDLVVHAPGSAMATLPSAVFVYPSVAGGYGTTASLEIREMLGDSLGRSVAAAGDVNGDGFGDLVVGAPRSTNMAGETRGRLLVYYGSAAGLTATSRSSVWSPTTDVDFACSADGVGDFDGDGYGDVVVGAVNLIGPPAGPRGDARVYFGSPTGLDERRFIALERPADVEIAADRVAGVGDVDGDGFADVVVHGRSPSFGAAILYFGNASRTNVSQAQRFSGSNDTFGEVVDGSADFDGDGLADFAVGDWASYEVHAMRGVRPRAPLARSWSFTKSYTPIQSFVRFATSINTADVNGDGRSDLFVGASHETSRGVDRAGVARFFLARPDGAFDEVLESVFDGEVPESTFGWATSLGDVDGDGVFDPCVGAFAAPRPSITNAGFVRCFAVRFNASTASEARRTTIDGAVVHGWFGATLAQ